MLKAVIILKSYVTALGGGPLRQRIGFSLRPVHVGLLLNKNITGTCRFPRTSDVSCQYNSALVYIHITLAYQQCYTILLTDSVVEPNTRALR